MLMFSRKLSNLTVNFMKDAMANHDDILILCKQRYASAVEKFFDENYFVNSSRHSIQVDCIVY